MNGLGIAIEFLFIDACLGFLKIWNKGAVIKFEGDRGGREPTAV